ncbi:hypothetical protein [Peribacillus simplex]|uniref:hypothetical protein n=1 Tax=Peribacillus simplex TaxID=1478 RepID=UPI003D002D13
MITVLSGIPEFEADKIKKRQLEGIELAKQRGVYKGRLNKLYRQPKRITSCSLPFNNRYTNKLTVNEISDITKISSATLYRAD